MVSADEFEPMEETEFLLRSPANAARLVAAADDVRRGRVLLTSLVVHIQVSVYAEAAVRRQMERDNLRALIAANEAIHGEVTAEEIRAASEEMYGPAADGPAS